MSLGMTMGLQTGDLLEGRYRIFERIGEGGMGVVYAAEHAVLHRKCAVKVLHPSEAGDETMIARFRIEAQAAANIRHPNVVEVMDFGISPDNRPFFVMEYLEGESLADRLDSFGRLTEKETVTIVSQILGGLSAAHRVRVVHRDLKPENIFLARIDKKTEVVKILDFGISKIVAGTPSCPPAPISANHKALTQKGIVFGTPGYMAPETLFGSGAVDPRADLFSVSVLLFEMLAGSRPFVGRDAQSIMLATASQPAPIPSEICPEISSAMEDVILKGLAKDPAFRFQKAEEFQERLQATQRGLLRRLSKPPSSTQKKARKAVELMDVTGKTSHSNGRHGNDNPVKSRLASEIEEERIRKRRDDLFRRISIGISPISILLFLGMCGAVYYYFFQQEPIHEVFTEDPIDSRIADRNRNPDKSAQNNLEPIPTVTVRIDGKPDKISVFIEGNEVFERPLIVPQGRDSLEVRFSADGYEDEIRNIVPDQEQTIVIRLNKIEAETEIKDSKRRQR
jgi:serine/threonine-protein kinase